MLVGSIITVVTGMAGSYQWSQADSSLSSFGPTTPYNCGYGIINAQIEQPPVSCTPITYGRPWAYIRGDIYALSASPIKPGVPVNSYNFTVRAVYNSPRLAADWLFWAVIAFVVMGVIYLLMPMLKSWQPKTKKSGPAKKKKLAKR